MRKIILPVAILALALSTAGAMAQTGASGTSGGAAKSGSDSTAPTAAGAKDSTAKPMTKTKKKKKM